jgi:hypothetical protein
MCYQRLLDADGMDRVEHYAEQPWLMMMTNHDRIEKLT